MSSEELNSILPLEIRQIIFAADFPLRNLGSCVSWRRFFVPRLLTLRFPDLWSLQPSLYFVFKMFLKMFCFPPPEREDLWMKTKMPMHFLSFCFLNVMSVGASTVIMVKSVLAGFTQLRL